MSEQGRGAGEGEWILRGKGLSSIKARGGERRQVHLYVSWQKVSFSHLFFSLMSPEHRHMIEERPRRRWQRTVQAVTLLSHPGQLSGSSLTQGY